VEQFKVMDQDKEKPTVTVTPEKIKLLVEMEDQVPKTHIFYPNKTQRVEVVIEKPQLFTGKKEAIAIPKLIKIENK